MVLWETDRSPVAEVSTKHGVSEQAIYAWRERFGVMNAAEVQPAVFVRMTAVVRMTCLGRSTICRPTAKDKYPSLVRLGKRAVASHFVLLPDGVHLSPKGSGGEEHPLRLRTVQNDFAYRLHYLDNCTGSLRMQDRFRHHGRLTTEAMVALAIRA